MVLKEQSYQNFRTLTSSSSRRKISQYCKSKSRIKSKVPLFKNLILEDADFVKRFGEEACKWLSSGTTSLSSSLENINFSLLSDPSMDEWLYFLLSLVQNPSLLANKYIACFDGSRVNPIEEAYLVMKKTLLESDTSHILQEDVKKGDEEEVVAWLSSIRSDATNSIASCSFRNCSELKKHLFLSLVNLDEESCWRDSDTDSDEFLSSSSSFSSMSRTVTTSSSDCASEDLNLGELGFNGPLVWPFDKKWNWRDREGKWDDFFVMSPTRQKHTRLQKDIKRERKNEHSKPINQANEIHKTNSTLRGMMGLKSRTVSLKVVPIDTADFTIESTPANLPGKCKTLEDEFFYLCGKHTIESLLGLEEFDGQEGIENGLWKGDDLYLQDSLC